MHILYSGLGMVLSVQTAFPTVSEAQTVSLNVEASDEHGCLLRDTLSPRLESIRGSDAIGTFANEVVVSVRAHRGERGEQVDVRVTHSDGQLLGTRSLATSEHCEALLDSIVLVASLMLDVIPPEFEPVSSELPDVASEDLRRRTLRIRIGPGVGVIAGLMPRVTPGFGAVLELDPAGLGELSFDLESWLPSDVEGQAGHARFNAFAAGFSYCPLALPEGRRAAVLGCANIRGGWLHGKGVGFEDSERGGSGTLDLGLRGGTRIELTSKFHLRLDVMLSYAAIQPRFFHEIDGARFDLHRVSPLSVTTRIAGLFEF